MRALGFRKHGDVDDIEILEVEDPAPPGPGEVLVDVKAASLNRLDDFVLKGWPGLKLEMPHWGGCDAAGVVAQVGEGVESLRVGDRVLLDSGLSCGHCVECRRDEPSLCPEYRLLGEHLRGGFAEKLVAPAANWHPFPDPMSFEQAAAFPLTFMTAWRALITRGALRAGEHVLVVGSGGGVNTAAIQIARHAGARVTVVAGGPAKVEHAKRLGADDVIDYKEEAFERAVFKRTNRRGVDLVFDNVGAATWTQSLKAAAKGGRIVTVGGTTGYEPPAGINYIMWKQLAILGSTMASRREFAAVRDLVYAGKLAPVIDRVMPLEKGREAYAHLAAGGHAGKIVLTI